MVLPTHKKNHRSSCYATVKYAEQLECDISDDPNWTNMHVYLAPTQEKGIYHVGQDAFNQRFRQIPVNVLTRN